MLNSVSLKLLLDEILTDNMDNPADINSTWLVSLTLVIVSPRLRALSPPANINATIPSRSLFIIFFQIRIREPSIFSKPSIALPPIMPPTVSMPSFTENST